MCWTTLTSREQDAIAVIHIQEYLSDLLKLVHHKPLVTFFLKFASFFFTYRHKYGYEVNDNSIKEKKILIEKNDEN